MYITVKVCVYTSDKSAQKVEREECTHNERRSEPTRVQCAYLNGVYTACSRNFSHNHSRRTRNKQKMSIIHIYFIHIYLVDAHLIVVNYAFIEVRQSWRWRCGIYTRKTKSTVEYIHISKICYFAAANSEYLNKNL